MGLVEPHPRVVTTTTSADRSRRNAGRVRCTVALRNHDSNQATNTFSYRTLTRPGAALRCRIDETEFEGTLRSKALTFQDFITLRTAHRGRISCRSTKDNNCRCCLDNQYRGFQDLPLLNLTLREMTNQERTFQARCYLFLSDGLQRHPSPRERAANQATRSASLPSTSTRFVSPSVRQRVCAKTANCSAIMAATQASQIDAQCARTAAA